MLKKGDIVAKVIEIMGTSIISFNYKVYYLKKGIARVDLHDNNDSCLEYNVNTGKEINGSLPGCSSYLITHEEGIKLVKSKKVNLDDGEILPKLSKKKEK